jgi:hypothetical protein
MKLQRIVDEKVMFNKVVYSGRIIPDREAIEG